MEFTDRSHLYEVLQPVEKIGRTEISEARERSTGTRVMYHRIALEDSNFDTEAVAVDLQQEALLINPRVALLIDAWRAEDALCYVRLEYSGVPLESPSGRGALQATGRDVFEEAAFQTLAALAALHDLTLTHKRVTAECYRVTPGGLVYLRDTGLWRRINERLETNPDAFVFRLASKSARRDVAEWGAMMAGFAAGTPFQLIEEDGMPTATPEEIERMQVTIRSAAGSKELGEMISESLEAFNNLEIGGYENAARALAKFPRRVLA
ncbi:MAG: hypothetical protein PWP23_692 [Candidatus Sumerlaeota bacterium]|nr:hypothetical protein [Candidatus Sumerlaeota bacterium]